MKQVRILKSCGGLGFSYQQGQIVVTSDSDATSLISAGLAELYTAGAEKTVQDNSELSVLISSGFQGIVNVKNYTDADGNANEVLINISGSDLFIIPILKIQTT